MFYNILQVKDWTNELKKFEAPKKMLRNISLIIKFHILLL